MMKEKTNTTPYDVLKVKSDSSFREIRRSYKKLVRQYTPEKEPEMFKKINLAYRQLTGDATYEGKDDGEHFILINYPVWRFEEYNQPNEIEGKDKRSPLLQVPETIIPTTDIIDDLLDGILENI